MPTSCKYDPTIGGAALLAELDEHGGGITALWRDRYQERISFASFKYRVWAARNGKAVPAAAMPFGKWRIGGCEGCPHLLRCRWLLARGWREPAEMTHLLCEFPMNQVKAAARRIDAQPEYRDWLKTQVYQPELIEDAA